MHPLTLAAACSTGTWQQKWDCGLNGHANIPGAAAHAAATFPPLLACVLIVLVLIGLARRRSATPAPGR